MFPEQRHFQGLFAPTELVTLRQYCFTPSRMFEPGVYFAGQLPGIAFEMGLVDKLPPVRGKNAEIRPAHPEPPDSSER
ncbi:MAG: hypothetical protein NW220_13725 [Leptolyngbyaceae cyanobacterium bins.349]|nr:hypothetical protein [Leptolyngbyaceae cyanobacterium bins.349]